MLTLTITDPHMLTAAEKAAVLAFCNITGVPRPDTIATADRPDVGLPPSVKALDPALPPAPAPAINAAAIFGDNAPAAPVASAGIPTPPAPATPSAIPTPPASAAPAGAPSAPSAPTAVSGPPVGASAKELDAAGLPWDHRIHAGTKTKKADGKWTKKKNVEAATIVAVESELRALLAIPLAGAVTGATSSVPGGMPLPPASIVPTFADLMGWITTEIAGGRLSQVDVVAGVSPLGLTSIVGLDARPDLIPQVRANLERIIAERVPKP